jgi:pyruvate carboxylase
MSGLLKPAAATKLISTLKQEIGIPIHLHTHDTTGNAVATVLAAADAGVDIADCAINAMAGLTSQPAMNSIVAALENTGRETGMSVDDLQKVSDYWAAVRPVYGGFESDLKSTNAEIYKYEIPGGQYSNLKAQVESFGLGHRFDDVKKMYRDVNMMLGDIVKVTPSSKVVGDLTIYMIQNDLTPENIYEKAAKMDFPDSVVTYFEGMMGQPEGGFPEELQKLVLKGKEPITCRPGELLPDEDFEAVRQHLNEQFGIEADMKQVMSYCMYPKVYENYLEAKLDNGEFLHMGSDVFFHGIREGETAEIALKEGKILVTKLVEIRKPDMEGFRELIFEVNGNRRTVKILDKAAKSVATVSSTIMAEEGNPNEVGANIPGTLMKLLVKEGDDVKEGDPIAVLEAMKMETNVLATATGKLAKFNVKEGQQVVAGELIATIE